MSVHAPRLQTDATLRRNASDREATKREAIMRLASHHFTASEFSELMLELAAGTLDVRLYDDGIVLMRRF